MLEDSEGRVWVLERYKQPVLVFDVMCLGIVWAF